MLIRSVHFVADISFTSQSGKRCSEHCLLHTIMTLTTPTARNGALTAATAEDSVSLVQNVTLNPATACWIIVNKQHF